MKLCRWDAVAKWANVCVFLRGKNLHENESKFFCSRWDRVKMSSWHFPKWIYVTLLSSRIIAISVRVRWASHDSHVFQLNVVVVFWLHSDSMPCDDVKECRIAHKLIAPGCTKLIVIIRYHNDSSEQFLLIRCSYIVEHNRTAHKREKRSCECHYSLKSNLLQWCNKIKQYFISEFASLCLSDVD